MGHRTTSMRPAAGLAAWRRALPVALVFCAGFALSGVAFVAVRKWEERRLNARFARLAGDRVAAVQKGVALALEQLQSIRRLFAASQLVERREFHDFVQGALAQHRAIQALQWVRRVPGADRATCEARARSDGLATFQLTERDGAGAIAPAGPRAEYFPVYYLVPHKGNETLLGLDLASAPPYREAMEGARDTGLAAAAHGTGPMRQAHGGPRLVAFLPIYRNGLPHETPAQRRENLLGFAAGIFRVADLVDEALSHLSMESTDVHLFDDSAAPGECLLHHGCSPAPSGPARRTQDPATLRSGLHVAVPFRVAGRNWTIVCTPTAEFFMARSTWQAWGVLVLGPLFTLLLTGYLLSLTGRTVRVEQLVGRRTAQLSTANENLEREVARRQQVEEALRQSEQRFRSLVETSSDWIWEVDGRGVYTYASPKVEDLLGYTADEVVGKTPFDFMPPDERERVLTEFEAAAKSQQPFEGLENTNRRKDGRLVVLETSGTPFFDAEGRLCGYRGVDRDITERKQAQERIRALNADLERRVAERTRELAKAYEELRELDRLKSVFMAVITHELRTPLMIMGGMLALAEDQLPAQHDKLQRMFQSARKAAKRLETLTARILEVANTGDFAVELRTEPVAPAELVADVVADATPFVELRGQRLTTEVAEQLSAVPMDRSKIRDVLLNLVMNAVKFTPDGGAIALAVTPTDDAVEFRVTDTGIGIADADKPHVFEEFFTTFDTMHHSTGDYEFQKRGIGVGLAVVKSFVEMHGGRVGVESTEGEGSTFWFALPFEAKAGS